MVKGLKLHVLPQNYTYLTLCRSIIQAAEGRSFGGLSICSSTVERSQYIGVVLMGHRLDLVRGKDQRRERERKGKGLM